MRGPVLLGVLFAAAGAQGQSFDVVDVRVAQPLAAGTVQVLLDEGPGVLELNPKGVSRVLARPFTANGTMTLRYYTMRQLVALAYREILSDEFLTGGPNWLDSDHFDLVAKTAPGTALDEMRVMLQRALEDRFRLAVHRESKPMPVLALAVGKRDRLPPSNGSENGGCKPVSGVEGLQHWACHMTMPILALGLPRMASGYIAGVVVDATGLAGAYDFQLDWAPRRDSDADPGATIFDALEKLGLKLEERKQPMTVIVIDHVDRIPTEN